MIKILLILLMFPITFSFSQSVLVPRIDSIIKPFQKADSPGFSIGIVQNGSIIYTKGVGLANLEYNIQNTDTSVFSIASIAKQFTASCIWSLIQENKLSLDDDVRKYIPELPYYGDTITIRHMLNHTSGIRNYHAIMELSGFDYYKEFYDNQFVLDLACRQKGLNNIPGEKVIYGNTAYTLLAITIERISHQKLSDYAKDKIFMPLAMNHSFFKTNNNCIIKNSAEGYVQNVDGSFSQFPSIQLSYGAGSMGSTIQDLTKWSNVLNGKNNKFIDLTHFLTQCEVLKKGDTAQYARGVMVDKYKGIKTIHHSGYGLGGQSQILAVPELNLSIIILTNLESIDPSPLSYKILDLFITESKTNTNLKTKHGKYKISIKDYLPFVGPYKELNSDMKMEIYFENDTLKSKGSQAQKGIALVAYDKGKFHRINNESVTYEFINFKNTAYDMIIYFGGVPFYFKRAVFVNPEKINCNEYIGNYYSSELSVDYQISTENGILYLSYPNHEKIKLISGQADEFGNGSRVLYSFKRNEKNVVIKLFVAAEGTVKDIEFVKKNQ